MGGKLPSEEAAELGRGGIKIKKSRQRLEVEGTLRKLGFVSCLIYIYVEHILSVGRALRAGTRGSLRTSFAC